MLSGRIGLRQKGWLWRPDRIGSRYGIGYRDRIRSRWVAVLEEIVGVAGTRTRVLRNRVTTAAGVAIRIRDVVRVARLVPRISGRAGRRAVELGPGGVAAAAVTAALGVRRICLAAIGLAGCVGLAISVSLAKRLRVRPWRGMARTVRIRSLAARSQAALSQAALSQAALSQAALSQAALSQAALSQAARRGRRRARRRRGSVASIS
jgi:hypothetical protein